jgi:hypothetical protein
LQKSGATGGGDIALYGILEQDFGRFGGDCGFRHTPIIPDL